VQHSFGQADDDMRERRDSAAPGERGPDVRLVASRDRNAGQFESALRGARIYVFSQDKELRATRVYSPRGEQTLPFPDSAEILAVKRRVLETGQPGDAEAVYVMPEGPVLFSLHVDPTFDPEQKLDGIMCAAIEVTRIRTLESEQERLTEELGRTLQRYETALRGSKVTVFTQDRELRYTSISNPFFGLEVRDIVGRTDEEIIPAESRTPILALKLGALESGLPRGGEIRLAEGASVRWYDLHVEPLRDVAGSIIGLTCAAVDVTERKEGEAHLRLLMRELTHRSKNLLAVIQAMARQTARHVGTIDAFLEQFSARLQALARSHDLLVQEEWHGVLLAELVRSQLAPYLDRSGSQIVMQGPPITLRPEAAQNLGLALHELAINAVKFGALSTPPGRLSITWAWQDRDPAPVVEMRWVESGGPAVTMPMQRGFGTLVVERNLARALEAEVELTFETEGVRARITIPVAQVLRPAPGET
jgi:PAS domain S-box-containing protein